MLEALLATELELELEEDEELVRLLDELLAGVTPLISLRSR